MAFTIKFARLFELKLFHGFYLDKGDEKNYFELTTSEEDERFKAFVLKGYNLLSKGLSIEPTEASKKVMRGHRMRFKALPDGFLVGVEVEEQMINGRRTFEPFIEIAPNTVLTFKVKASDPNWSNFSNSRINANLPAVYYFSNFTENQLTYPSLALQAEERQTRFYEMGELVFDPAGTGQLYEALKGVENGIAFSNPQSWLAVDDFNYVNYRNKLLLPFKFDYTFTPNPGQLVTQATFELFDLENNSISLIDTPLNDAGWQQFKIDFSQVDDLLPGQYILQVSNGDNSYLDRKQIMLDDDLYDSSLLAVVAIGHQEDLTNDFRLLEQDGILRMNDDDDEPEHPEFHLRFRNRKTYWRYFLHPDQDVITPPISADVEADPNDTRRLVTTAVKPLTATGLTVNLNPNVTLPNPDNLLVRMDLGDDERKYYSHIRLGVLNNV